MVGIRDGDAVEGGELRELLGGGVVAEQAVVEGELGQFTFEEALVSVMGFRLRTYQERATAIDLSGGQPPQVDADRLHELAILLESHDSSASEHHAHPHNCLGVRDGSSGTGIYAAVVRRRVAVYPTRCVIQAVAEIGEVAKVEQ